MNTTIKLCLPNIAHFMSARLWTTVKEKHKKNHKLLLSLNFVVLEINSSLESLLRRCHQKESNSSISKAVCFVQAIIDVIGNRWINCTSYSTRVSGNFTSL